jgi:pSer/pThr/pTyr-binding forkhead associated (FHA) protein
VNDPIISRFAEACGARAPLDLRVDLVDGGLLAEGSVPMPFALVGRDDACDVTLTDAEVNPRHAWLQVLAGRAFAIDLGSRTGLGWPDGRTGSGRMEPNTPVRIGPFQIRLQSPVSPRPATLPADHHPLQSNPECLRSHPTVTLEFRNGKRAQDRWKVNRLVTLIGRAPECKINLSAEDIAGYHCGLVLTPDGLWVVDLSARGVVVNGERMRVSPLAHGAELWVGRFLIGVNYPGEAQDPRHGRTGLIVAPLTGVAEALRPGAENAHATAHLAAAPATTDHPEDEVPLGLESAADAGLPSSHIMADVFRLWSPASGPASNPIAVGASGAIASAPPRSTPPQALLDMLATPDPSPTPPLPPNTSEAANLLRQLGDIHSQLFTQFQNSLVLMVRLFGCLRRDELPAMQRELARIQDLNAELAQLQGEVARRAAEVAPPLTPPPRSTPRGTTSTPTPLPDQLPTVPPGSTALHDWLMERINSLQRERLARWQSLVGLVSGKSA